MHRNGRLKNLIIYYIYTGGGQGVRPGRHFFGDGIVDCRSVV